MTCPGESYCTPSPVAEVIEERRRQDEKWGEQDHPDGTGGRGSDEQANMYRSLCDARHGKGNGSWFDILKEEVFEAGAEADELNLRAELIQVAAVAVSWVESIDRRRAR